VKTVPYKHTSRHDQNPLGDAKAATRQFERAVADARSHPAADSLQQAQHARQQAEDAVAQAASDANQRAFSSRLEALLAAEQELMRLSEEGPTTADDD
jgi:hypothetical protein